MINEIFLSTKSEFNNSETYKKICKVIKKLDRAGIIRLASGYCLSSCDIIQTALKHESINCRLVECSCTISNKDTIWAVGYEQVINPGEIDTHVVIITDTNPSFLIDASIGHKIGGVIVDVLPKTEIVGNDKILADYYFIDDQLKATYIEKKFQRMPYLHQSSILNRIEMDNTIFKEIRYLKYLNYIGISLSSFAVIAVINQIFRWFF